MSEQQSTSSLTKGISPTTNHNHRQTLELTIAQAAMLTQATVAETQRIEHAVCQRFGVASLDALSDQQLEEAQRWVLYVSLPEEFEATMRGVFDRLNSARLDVANLAIRFNSLRVLMAKQFPRVLAVVLMLMLALPPVMAATLWQEPVTSRRSAMFRLPALTYESPQDGQIIVKPYTTTGEIDVMMRAKANLEADPFPNVQDAELILKAVQYASNFAISAVVDRVFLEDCVDGFPMASLLKDQMRLDAAVLTEIPGTNYSPAMYLLATMDKAGDINRGPLMVYFGTLLGPKAYLARTPSPTPNRQPNIGEEFGLVWQNGFPALVKEVTQRRDNPRGKDDCIACLDVVKANAARVRDGKRITAAAVATAAGIGCAAISVGVFAAICFAAAAAALIGTLKWIYAEYDEKIFTAQRGICAINKDTGQSCQWER